jgi:hypothetical protein
MPNELVKLLLFAAVALVAYTVLIKKNDTDVRVEHYGGGDVEPQPHPAHVQAPVADKKVSNAQLDDVYQTNPNVLPHPQMSNTYAPANFDSSNSHNFAQLDCFPKDQLTASDLLPTEGGFAESNPMIQGQLMQRNLFESGHHGGLNTQGSSNRNGNRQLRSDPLIPRKDIGPWSMSTIEPDTNRRPFEIGGY